MFCRPQETVSRYRFFDSSFCNRYHFCPPSICLIHSPRVIHLTYILENLFIPILFESLFIDRRKTREPMNGTATRWYKIFAGNSLIINNYQLTIMVWKERERERGNRSSVQQRIVRDARRCRETGEKLTVH